MADAESSWDGTGLYFHIPFCAHVCPYCDFAVQTGGEARRKRFVEHLRRELRLVSEASSPLTASPIDTLYFGGGTPSHLEPSAIGQIVETAREWLPIAADAWLFLETNPEDASPDRLEAWRQLG